MYCAWKQIVYVKQWVKLKKACTLFTLKMWSYSVKCRRLQVGQLGVFKVKVGDI